jgi:hypothetical protein
MSEQREQPGPRETAQLQHTAALAARQRRRQARAALVAIARTEGLQWLLREVQVIALWSATPS